MTGFKKKVLSLAIAGTMVLSSNAMAFGAAPTASEKLDKIVEFGIIRGEGDGIIADQTLSRYRAFILQLRLMGKAEEFENFDYKGKDTFADASQYSDYIQKLAAYLKAHPELGIVGYDDGSLKPFNNITSKEYTIIMLKTLGYEMNKDFTWDNVMTFAESLGIITLNHSAQKELNVNDAAVYTYDTLCVPSKDGNGTLGENLGFVIKDTLAPIIKFEKYDETTDNRTITLEGSLNEAAELIVNGEKVELNSHLEFAVKVELKVGKNKILFETTDKTGNKSTKEIIITREVTDLEIDDIYSDSNKQVHIVFNNELDPETVKSENFVIKNNTISKIQLEDDNKTVTLIVSSKFEQQSEQTITKIENLKDIDGNTLETQKNLKFKSKDVTLPKIVKVEVEKNNEIKLTFSEPVQEAQAINSSNYTLNGKRFVGTVKNYDHNSIILYSKNFEDENTLVVKNIKDFNNLIMDEQTLEFEYSVDKEAPEVTEVLETTLERVKIKFNEKIDFSSVKKSNIKWAYSISSTSGKSATSFEKIDDYTLLVHFKNDNSLPPATVNIILNGIKDLSGNVIEKDTAIEVTAEIDETRPEIVSITTEYVSGATTSNNGVTKFTVNFSKNILDADSTNNLANNFEILDENGKKVNKSINLEGNYSQSTNKIVFTVSNLAEGDYTLVIKNIKDDTKLANKMLDTEYDFTIVNKKVPKLTEIFKSTSENKLYIQFSESMNSTITDASNYMIKKSNGSWAKLSSELESAITTMEDETFAVIHLKNPLSDYMEIEISLVENQAGNTLDGLKVNKDLTSIAEIGEVSPSINKVEVTAKDQIKVYLNKEVVDAYHKDFVIGTVSDTVYYNNLVSNFDIDVTTLNSSKVSVITIDFDKEIFNANATLIGSNENIIVSASNDVNYTVDSFGNKITGSAMGTDKIGASLITEDKTITANSGNLSVTLTFDENIGTSAGLYAYAANDLVIINEEGETLIAGEDYTISVSENTVIINFANEMAGDYSISTANSINFLKDTNSNTINSFNDITITLN